MLEGVNSVLEIGAGDGFKSRIVSQSVKNLSLSDYTDTHKLNYQKNFKTNNKNDYFVHDFTKKKLNKKFDAIYALDVIEHISKKKEKQFIINIINSLKKK